MMTLAHPDQSKKAMWELAEALFPIHRTLVNRGFDESLALVRERLAMTVQKYPSGQSVWDWEIPNAWDVREAYIADTKGNKLVDYKNHNLHLSAYSIPFHGRVSKEELLKHLKYTQDFPDAIPYNFLYYTRNWEFNIAYNQLAAFTDDAYDVHVDVDSRPGELKIAECYIPGKSKQEILFSTYMCHPSMANDNLSGVLVGVELFKLLKQMPTPRYSYRLLILPETVGAIAYLAHHERQMRDVIGGINLYICGDRGPITYKRTYAGNTLIDRAMCLALKESETPHSVRNFIPFGSDERQYNAPGVRLPVGGFTRTPPGEYKEYHTSKDDLTVITPEALLDSLAALYRTVQTLELNRTYTNHYKGEPLLSKHNVTFESFFTVKKDLLRNSFRIFINEIDGTHSLLDIAEKWELPIEHLAAMAGRFAQGGLISEIEEAIKVPDIPQGVN